MGNAGRLIIIGSGWYTSASGGVTAANLNSIADITSKLSSFLGDQGQQANRPKAYVNWILFDENFRPVISSGNSNSGFDAVNDNGGRKAHTRSTGAITKNGYLYVYCSNESKLDVFFDNLQVIHSRGALLEETHYYPFGLTMAGISSKALKIGFVENNIKFQGQEFASIEFNDGSGLEIYEFKWRTHDPQVGRFWQVDPISDKYEYNSTYAFSENKVTNHVEMEGLESVTANVASHYKEYASRQGVSFIGSTTNGMVSNQLITQRQISKLEKGTSDAQKSGVILHRTVSSSALSTLNSFESRGVGTHFLVGTDGTIYQTASLDQKTSHIRESQVTVEGLTNANTIGIEVVGNYNSETKTWDPVTNEQALSVAFLVNSLITTYGLTNDNIYNHEDIQPKTAGEGGTVNSAIRQYINSANNAPPNPLGIQNNNNQNSSVPKS